jgi:hypothetical protein
MYLEDRGSSGHVDQLVAGHSAVLDQIYHGQKVLPIVGEELAQIPSVYLPLLVDHESFVSRWFSLR